MLAALTEARALVGEGALVAPPAHLRDQVLAHLQDTDDAPRRRAHPAPVGDRSQERPTRRGVPAWAAGLAAAAALVAGLGLGRLTVGEPDQPEATQPPTPTGRWWAPRTYGARQRRPPRRGERRTLRRHGDAPGRRARAG